jgi:hypothetical protein
MKFRFVFWDVMPSDVSEVRAASIIRAMSEGIRIVEYNAD